jgi:hypothetical protein
MNRIESNTFAGRMKGNFPAMTDEQVLELAGRLEHEDWSTGDASAALSAYIGTAELYSYAGFNACRPRRHDYAYQRTASDLAKERKLAIELSADEKAADEYIATLTDEQLAAGKARVLDELKQRDEQAWVFYSARNPRTCRYLKMGIWEGRED